MDVGDGGSPAASAPRGAAEVGGPRAWVVLLGTVVAAALVIGGILGWRAWQNDDDGTAAVPDSNAAAPATTDAVDEGGENQLFRRTTADGIEVRARLLDMAGGGFVVERAVPATVLGSTAAAGTAAAGTAAAAGEGDGNDLPDFCEITGDLTAWAIGDETIVQGGAPWTKAAPAELFPSLMWDGRPGVASIVGVVLQVDAGVTSVRLTGPDGSVDEMEPVDGAVVLAVPLPAELEFNPFDVRPGAADGARLQVTARRADGTTLRASPDDLTRGHPAWAGDQQCFPEQVGPGIPPPIPEVTLPQPGAEQPADPAAARAEIEHNFSALYGPSDPNVDRSQYIDDNYGFDVAREQLVANGFADESDAASVAIDDLVFTSATEAVFSYDLTTPAASFPGQVGRARLLDGVWKITRSTLCQDFSKAGAMCPP